MRAATPGTGGVSIVREFSCGIVVTLLHVVDGNSRVAQMLVTMKDGQDLVVSRASPSCHATPSRC